MRAIVRSLIAVMAIAASVFAGRADVSLTVVSASPGYFDIAAIAPVRGAEVGVAHPVVVTFNNPITNRQAAERAIAVKSVPAMTGKFEWIDNYVVQWVPDRFWPAHSTVALSVGGVRTDFKTGPVVLGVADIANHTFTVTIDGVEAQPPPSVASPHHRLHFGEAGVLPASMGRPEYETPVGTYSVLGKDRSVTMDSSSVGIPVNANDGYRLQVEYAVRITNRGLYVHSAPWAVPAMGVENVSHGCISLTPTDAEWYFDTVHLGDPVIVKDGVPSVVTDKQADEGKKADPVLPPHA